MNRSSTPALTFTLTAVTLLYLAHSLPLYFFSVALPAILRQQAVDLRWIGMISLLFLPWALKFFWAPWVDRYYIRTLGKRRTWLLFTQLAVVAGVVALAFTGLSYGFLPFIAIALWISTLAATQDIAIDGYAVEAFNQTQYSFASSAQSVGVALGSMIGGAGTLWLYDLYGWQPALLLLAVLSGITITAILMVRERAAGSAGALGKHVPSFKRVLARPEIRRLLAVIVVFRTVESPAMAMLNPMLVDAQWSLTQIGLLFSVVGAFVGILAAVTAGWLIRRQGAVHWLLVSGWLRSLMYALLAIGILAGIMRSWMLAGIILGILGTRYLAMTALYAHFMAHCSKEQAGTDFTVLVCFELLVYFLGAAISGFLAKPFGYGWFYFILCIVSCVSVLWSRHLLAAPRAHEEGPAVS